MKNRETEIPHNRGAQKKVPGNVNPELRSEKVRQHSEDDRRVDDENTSSNIKPPAASGLSLYHLETIFEINESKGVLKHESSLGPREKVGTISTPNTASSFRPPHQHQLPSFQQLSASPPSRPSPDPASNRRFYLIDIESSLPRPQQQFLFAVNTEHIPYVQWITDRFVETVQKFYMAPPQRHGGRAMLSLHVMDGEFPQQLFLQMLPTEFITELLHEPYRPTVMFEGVRAHLPMLPALRLGSGRMPKRIRLVYMDEGDPLAMTDSRMNMAPRNHAHPFPGRELASHSHSSQVAASEISQPIALSTQAAPPREKENYLAVITVHILSGDATRPTTVLRPPFHLDIAPEGNFSTLTSKVEALANDNYSAMPFGRISELLSTRAITVYLAYNTFIIPGHFAWNKKSFTDIDSNGTWTMHITAWIAEHPLADPGGAPTGMPPQLTRWRQDWNSRAVVRPRSQMEENMMHSFNAGGLAKGENRPERRQQPPEVLPRLATDSDAHHEHVDTYRGVRRRLPTPPTPPPHMGGGARPRPGNGESIPIGYFNGGPQGMPERGRATLDHYAISRPLPPIRQNHHRNYHTAREPKRKPSTTQRAVNKKNKASTTNEISNVDLDDGAPQVAPQEPPQTYRDVEPSSRSDSDDGDGGISGSTRAQSLASSGLSEQEQEGGQELQDGELPAERVLNLQGSDDIEMGEFRPVGTGNMGVRKTDSVNSVSESGGGPAKETRRE